MTKPTPADHLSTDSPIEEIRLTAAAIAQLATEVMDVLEHAMQSATYAIRQARDLTNPIPPPHPDDAIKFNIRSEKPMQLPLGLQVFLPGHAHLVLELSFHAQHTTAIVMHFETEDNQTSVLALTEDRLDNEEPGDFYGWISTVISIWQMATLSNPTFRTLPGYTYTFNRNQKTAIEFSERVPFEMTQNRLFVRRAATSGEPFERWIQIDPYRVSPYSDMVEPLLTDTLNQLLGILERYPNEQPNHEVYLKRVFSMTAPWKQKLNNRKSTLLGTLL